MSKNYVECERCNRWSDIDRTTELCKECNNSKLVIDPEDRFCNLCGGNLCPLGTPNEMYSHGLVDANVVGGYNSYHLFDLTRYTFSFCEKCLRRLFNECQIKPKVEDLNLSGDANLTLWEEDQKAYEYRVWKDEGGHHQAYLNRKCNAAKDCPNDAVYTKLCSGNFTEDCSCEEHKELRVWSNTTLVKFIQDNLKVFL